MSEESLDLAKEYKPVREHEVVSMNDFEKASVNKRVIAFFLDMAIGVPLALVLNAILEQFLFNKIIFSITSNLLFSTCYYVIPTFLYGKTIGKKLLGLEVIDFKGEKRNFFQIFFRETIAKFISGIVLFLGYIWFRFQKDHRAWHDLMARTIVVQTYKE